ncbi:MAG: AbrB family transcriptional regulator [Rhodospirillaceae bacterium]|nr:AbrB family transcriptional regulator [Rhodospirillaceae bacterium]
MKASEADSTPNKKPAATLRSLTLSLCLGAAGGAAFYSLSLPLPWMLGAMATTAIAAVAGQPIAMSRHMRQVMIAVIGVLLGSAFNPAMIGQISQWLASLILLTVLLGVLGVAVPWFLRRLGYDQATAFFSALPAGLTEMTAIGTENGGNTEIIALTHTVRVLLIAFIIPFTMVMLLGYDRPSGTGPAMTDLSGTDLALLAGCALIGLWLGSKLNLPAGALAGPLALSAIIHLTGLTASSPPGVLIATAQVVLGTSVGARFSGLTLATTGRTISLSAIVTLGMLTLSGLAAFTIGPLIGVNSMVLLLALSPGGVTEMSLMALALNQDIAFVTTHHVVRIALIVMIGPAVYSMVIRLGTRGRQPSTSESQK